MLYGITCYGITLLVLPAARYRPCVACRARFRLRVACYSLRATGCVACCTVPVARCLLLPYYAPWFLPSFHSLNMLSLCVFAAPVVPYRIIPIPEECFPCVCGASCVRRVYCICRVRRIHHRYGSDTLSASAAMVSSFATPPSPFHNLQFFHPRHRRFRNLCGVGDNTCGVCDNLRGGNDTICHFHRGNSNQPRGNSHEPRRKPGIGGQNIQSGSRGKKRKPVRCRNGLTARIYFDQSDNNTR